MWMVFFEVVIYKHCTAAQQGVSSVLLLSFTHGFTRERTPPRCEWHTVSITYHPHSGPGTRKGHDIQTHLIPLLECPALLSQPQSTKRTIINFRKWVMHIDASKPCFLNELTLLQKSKTWIGLNENIFLIHKWVNLQISELLASFIWRNRWTQFLPVVSCNMNHCTKSTFTVS